MKLTNEEIKRLIFEADETDAKEKINKQSEDSKADTEADSEETQTDTGEKQAEEKTEEANSVDNQSDDSQGEEKPGEIKSELTADGWDVRDKDGITYFLKRTDDSNVFYILNFSKLFSESKFLAKIRELILEEGGDNRNTTCILELVNTDTGIAYGPFTLETADNYVEIKKAIAEKAKEVVDSNWSEEFADKEFTNVSGMTKLLANTYTKEKPADSADKEEQSSNGEKQEEQSEKYIVDKINDAFSKLTEGEQNAFEVIYGDKLINKIQGN